MLKHALMAGVALMMGGIASGCWPDDNVLQYSRRLVATRTYERRGPIVTVDRGADRVRTADRRTLATTMLLGADGYWVRARTQYLTRESLRGTRVLVLDRPWDDMGDRRTTTLVTRWIHEGGSAIVLAAGQGPEVRRGIGGGRVAVIDPSAFETAAFVERLLDAMHWLDGDADVANR